MFGTSGVVSVACDKSNVHIDYGLNPLVAGAVLAGGSSPCRVPFQSPTAETILVVDDCQEYVGVLSRLAPTITELHVELGRLGHADEIGIGLRHVGSDSRGSDMCYVIKNQRQLTLLIVRYIGVCLFIFSSRGTMARLDMGRLGGRKRSGFIDNSWS